MAPVSQIHHDLLRAVDDMARLPLLDLLEQQGILQSLARELVLQDLRREVRFSSDERDSIHAQLCQGLACEPPESLEGDWIEALPEGARETVSQRWDHLRLQKSMEDRYGERVEAHFLERREALEQVVFRLMRLPQQGLAEELYLRLIDDDASFGDLASRYSIGDESVTRGLVGPIVVSQLHATLRGVLAGLAVGEIHPPFLLEQSILLVRLDHRRPACLDEALRHRLLGELLQPDLETMIETVLAELRHSLAPVAMPSPPSLALAGG